MTSKATHFPQDVLKRFAVYLQDFQDAPAESSVTVSEMARRYHIEERDMRRELAALTGSGELRSKYPIALLRKEIESFLGYHNLSDVAMVGNGPLAQGLLKNAGFAKNGLAISVIFDPELGESETAGESRVLPLSKISDLSERLHVHLGIVAVGPAQAQAAADALIAGGVQAIWNLSNEDLVTPAGVLVENESFGEHEDVAGNERVALSLVVLARHLGQRLGWN